MDFKSVWVTVFLPDSLASLSYIPAHCLQASRITTETLVEEATWVFQGHEESVTFSNKKTKKPENSNFILTTGTRVFQY